MLAYQGLYAVNLDDTDDVSHLEMLGTVGGMCEIDSQIFAALADSDAIMRMSLNNQDDETAFLFLGQELVNEQGIPYANTNTNSIVCDAATERLYASRGADNQISVVDSNTLQEIGRIPTGEYPTQLSYDSVTNRLWMTEGKGGTAPNNGRTGKSVISGFARVMNLNNINLEDATALAEQNFEHPKSFSFRL